MIKTNIEVYKVQETTTEELEKGYRRKTKSQIVVESTSIRTEVLDRSAATGGSPEEQPDMTVINEDSSREISGGDFSRSVEMNCAISDEDEVEGMVIREAIQDAAFREGEEPLDSYNFCPPVSKKRKAEHREIASNKENSITNDSCHHASTSCGNKQIKLPAVRKYLKKDKKMKDWELKNKSSFTNFMRGEITRNTGIIGKPEHSASSAEDFENEQSEKANSETSVSDLVSYFESLEAALLKKDILKSPTRKTEKKLSVDIKESGNYKLLPKTVAEDVECTPIKLTSQKDAHENKTSKGKYVVSSKNEELVLEPPEVRGDTQPEMRLREPRYSSPADINRCCKNFKKYPQEHRFIFPDGMPRTSDDISKNKFSRSRFVSGNKKNKKASANLKLFSDAAKTFEKAENATANSIAATSESSTALNKEGMKCGGNSQNLIPPLIISENHNKKKWCVPSAFLKELESSNEKDWAAVKNSFLIMFAIGLICVSVSVLQKYFK